VVQGQVTQIGAPENGDTLFLNFGGGIQTTCSTR
jgi:hypothetical protein